MGDIVFEDSKILFVDNKIAFDCACECVTPVCLPCTHDGDGIAPASMALTITGFTNGGCDECAAELNGLFICDWALGANPCIFRYFLDICGADPGDTFYQIIFTHDTFSHDTDIEVRLVRNGSIEVSWESLNLPGPFDCATLDEDCPHNAGSFPGCVGGAGTTCNVSTA